MVSIKFRRKLTRHWSVFNVYTRSEWMCSVSFRILNSCFRDKKRQKQYVSDVNKKEKKLEIILNILLRLKDSWANQFVVTVEWTWEKLHMLMIQIWQIKMDAKWERFLEENLVVFLPVWILIVLVVTLAIKKDSSTL